MPIYEYECNDCGTTQEVITRRGATPPPCATCGGNKVARKLSTFAVGTSSDPEAFCAKYPEQCTSCAAAAGQCPLPQ